MSVPEMICPRCATTYRAEATQCADCEVVLVDSESFEGLPSSEAPEIDFEGLVCIRASDSTWAEGFHAALEEGGLNAHIAAVDTGSGPLQVGVFVDPEDQERALEIDHAFSRSHLGLDSDQLQAGRCGICNTPLVDGSQELCEECRRDLEPEPERQEVVMGSDGVPRHESADEESSGALTNLLLLGIGALLGVAALYWMR